MSSANVTFFVPSAGGSADLSVLTGPPFETKVGKGVGNWKKYKRSCVIEVS